MKSAKSGEGTTRAESPKKGALFPKHSLVPEILRLINKRGDPSQTHRVGTNDKNQAAVFSQAAPAVPDYQQEFIDKFKPNPLPQAGDLQGYVSNQEATAFAVKAFDLVKEAMRLDQDKEWPCTMESDRRLSVHLILSCMPYFSREFIVLVLSKGFDVLALTKEQVRSFLFEPLAQPTGSYLKVRWDKRIVVDGLYIGESSNALDRIGWMKKKGQNYPPHFTNNARVKSSKGVSHEAKDCRMLSSRSTTYSYVGNVTRSYS